MSDSKQATRLALSFVISLFFLYLTFFKPDFGGLLSGTKNFSDALFGQTRFNLDELGHAIASANWYYILIAALFFVASLLLRAVRWRMMISPLTKMSFGQVFGAMNIGYMANNVLPFRMGEVYRAHVVYQMTGLSRSSAFGTIVLERLTDLLFLIPFIGLALLLYPLPPQFQKAAYILASAAFLGTGCFFWVVIAREKAITRLRSWLKILPHKVAEKIMFFLETFVSGLEVLGRKESYFWLSLISVAMWLIYSAVVYLMMASVGLTSSEFPLIANDKIGAAFVMLIVTTIGFIIPGAPGAIGTYHGVAVLGLSLFNVPGDRAAGFAVLLHALNYIPLTVLGLVYLLKYGISFKATQNIVKHEVQKPMQRKLTASELEKVE